MVVSARRGVSVALVMSLVGVSPVMMPVATAAQMGGPDSGGGSAWCAQRPLVDPPVWEAALPIAAVAAGVRASDPACLVEVGRDARRVVWRNADGTLSARLYSAPVNFRDVEGVWRPIDTRLVPVADGGFENRAGPFTVRFPPSIAGDLVTLEADGLRAEVALVSAFGERPSGDAPGAVRVLGGDGVRFAEVVGNVEVEYRVVPEGVKELIVVEEARGGAPEVAFDVGVSGGRLERRADGAVVLADADGPVFTVPSGRAWDATGASTGVRVGVTANGEDAWRVVFSLDPSWFTDASRVFPVSIDPSFVSGVSTDAYVADSSPAENFDGVAQFDVGAGQYWDRAGTSGATVYRSFSTFPALSDLQNATVLSATWKAYAYSVVGTLPFNVTVRPLAQSASWDATSVTWNDQPAVRSGSANASVGAANAWVTADITSWVQHWADGSWANTGIRVHGPTGKAANLAAEEAPAEHRSFVDVVYDVLPTVGSVSVDADGVLYFGQVNDPTPTFEAVIEDADTTSGLVGKFEVWNANHTSRLAFGDGTAVTRGQASEWTAPTLAPGVYSWRVAASDGSGRGGWSSWQGVQVDTSAPNVPLVALTSSTENTWTSVAPTAEVQAWVFPNNSTDVWAYRFDLDGHEQLALHSAPLGGVIVPVTPGHGWHTLRVQSLDRAGNLSAVREYEFGHGPGAFVEPADALWTRKNVAIEVMSATSYDGIALQYRSAEAEAWQSVPAAHVSSDGVPVTWPVAATGGAYAKTYPELVWDAAATAGGADGPLQLRVAFSAGGAVQAYLHDAMVRDVVLDQLGMGSAASAPAGPGTVDLVSGNLTLSALDVTTVAGTLGRSFQSRDANAPAGIFGPGWASSIGAGGAPLQSLVDNGSTVVVTAADESLLTFRLQPDGSYRPEDGADGYELSAAGGDFVLELLGFVTYMFTRVDVSSDEYVLTAFDDSTSGAPTTTSWQVVGGLTRPVQMVAAPTGVSCAESLTTRGCQTVSLEYASVTTATGTPEASWGDYAGQVRAVRLTAWDPEFPTPAMRTVTVAGYLYDSTGRLRATWDPRISPALKTRYGYDTHGRVGTVVPPGEEPWTFTYAPLSGEPTNTGRLGAVTRPALPSGTASTTFVYRIPLQVAGGGPHDMTAGDVARWAQHDEPVDATAIFPPDQAPSGSPPVSYERASVVYMNVEGQQVNSAMPGGAITTTEHDDVGNVVRELSAGNRQRALDAGSTPGEEAATALLVDHRRVYHPAGVLLTDTYGPTHDVVFGDGSEGPARAHTRWVYDEGAPGGDPYFLATSVTTGAMLPQNGADRDVQTLEYEYSIGADTTGWTLGTPLRTVVDPGSGPALNLATTTLYDAAGHLVERRLPAGPSGGTAHSTQFLYYTAGPHPSDSACGNTPEWDGLACKTRPAAQPGTAGLPDLPVTTFTKYNMYGQATEAVDTSDGQTRTTVTGYDLAGRVVTHDVDATIGTDVAMVTTGYSPTTGRVVSSADGTAGSLAVYDTLGRVQYYLTADNLATYSYDVRDRITSVHDGKATTSYTYDGGGERRGLPTGITDSVVGAFTATYDLDGNLAARTVPGGLTATYRYDTTGTPTAIDYTKGAGWWPTITTTRDVHGRIVTQGGWLDRQAFSYDAAGRLTRTHEDVLFGCNQRDYAFDPNTNRTGLDVRADGNLFGGTLDCPTATPTTTTYSYDSADRITTSGYSYDAFGRTLTVPAAHSLTGTNVTLAYYANDLVRGITTNADTTTYTLDAHRRVRTWTTSTDNQTRTHHYTADGDTPAWISENTDHTLWTRYINGFGSIAHHSQAANSVQVAVVDLHGDIIATTTPTDTDISTATWTPTDEYGIPGGGTGKRYDYLGTHQRTRDHTSGIQLMGVRLLNNATGRFLQPDSITGGSANSYDYCAAMPIVCADISGLHWEIAPPSMVPMIIGRGQQVKNPMLVLRQRMLSAPWYRARDFYDIYGLVFLPRAGWAGWGHLYAEKRWHLEYEQWRVYFVFQYQCGSRTCTKPGGIWRHFEKLVVQLEMRLVFDQGSSASYTGPLRCCTHNIDRRELISTFRYPK